MAKNTRRIIHETFVHFDHIQYKHMFCIYNYFILLFVTAETNYAYIIISYYNTFNNKCLQTYRLQLTFGYTYLQFSIGYDI